MLCQSNSRLYTIGCFVAIGGFLCGYQTGIMSGVFIMPSFIKKFGDKSNSDGIMTIAISSGIVSSLLSGCVLGALIAGQISDRLSRKHSIILSSMVFIIGAVLQAISCCSSMLLIARIVGGKSYS